MIRNFRRFNAPETLTWDGRDTRDTLTQLLEFQPWMPRDSR
jgi:hypothetical protein